MVVHKHAISETADSQALVGVDVKNTIRPSLMSLKNIVIEGHHKARYVQQHDSRYNPSPLLACAQPMALMPHAARRCCAYWTSRPAVRRSSPRSCSRYVARSMPPHGRGGLPLIHVSTGPMQLSSLENKAKKQEEIYRAEKAALEANMADKVPSTFLLQGATGGPLPIKWVVCP